MTLASVERIFAAVVNGVGGFQIDEVLGETYNSNIQDYTDPGADGNVFPRYITGQSTDPGIELKSAKLTELLSSIGLGVFDLNGTNTLDLFFAKASSLGEGLASGSVHTKSTVSYGLIYPMSIQVGEDPPGEMSIMVSPVSNDGATNPVSLTNSVALPTPAAFDEGYVVGPLTLNGTVIDGVKSYRIDFGANVVKRRADGSIHNVFINLFNFRPTVAIELIGQEAMDKFASLFSLAYASTTKFYLRHCANDGVRTADGTTSHISATMTAGKFNFNGYGKTAEGETTYNIELKPRYDGSNDPLQFGVGVAIS